MNSPDSPTARQGPTAPRERIGSLDVLRGFALLGILVMNIQAFAMPQSAYINPTAYGELTGANRWVWILSHVLTDQKMMTIFSMLFGAGILLFTSRLEARGQPVRGRHNRRMFWLILFGLLHGYLLWYGDILFLYGICGLIVYGFRELRPRWLLILGVLVIAIHTPIYLFFGSTMPHWPEKERTGFRENTWQPPPEKIEWEVTTYRGGWLQQMDHRVRATFAFETFGLLIWGFWRAAGLMLVGMGLYKLGVFSARGSPRFYAGLIAAALLVGVPVVVYGINWNFSHGWPPVSLFYGSQFNYWGSLLVSLGWVGAVMLICQRRALGWLTRRLAAVGQMAFSNYFLHTLICTTIFYGHGLGLFGSVERWGQIVIVFAVWGLQLLVSPIWLRRFRFGPLEWLWRSLTYGQRQPMRRHPQPLAA
ncbi:DUF418 domain-containing protein [Acidobacteriia bacterium AH_259_A11_L15]|nr:DUF418 domain-containing protein [Acidobacteriia bacterium AH_259_A11_L15]